MEVVEVHLLHGFLGIPEDWKNFKEILSHEIKGEGLLCRFFSHNLWDDFQEVIDASPHGQKDYLEVWGENKGRALSLSQQQKFFIGYSLGGRLLMHLPLHAMNNIKGLALIASHPGLEKVEDRKQRLIDDCMWSERFIDEQWHKLMDAWNSQSIFRHDQSRPPRDERRYSRKLLCRYFKEWGLGIQKPKDSVMANSGVPFYWFYGEKDSKVAALLPRMKKLVGPNHCFRVEGAGHGCHWDNPKHLAQLLVPLLKRG